MFHIITNYTIRGKEYNSRLLNHKQLFESVFDQERNSLRNRVERGEDDSIVASNDYSYAILRAHIRGGKRGLPRIVVYPSVTVGGIPLSFRLYFKSRPVFSSRLD